MPRGRPRKPPGQVELEGTRSTGFKLKELFTPRGAPYVPDHLDEDAQICAENIIRCFRETNRLSMLDSYVLSVFATAWAWHKAAIEATRRADFEPVVVTPKGSLSANPWLKIMNEAARMMLQCSPKLYLSPADRMTLTIGKQAEDSKFEGLLGGYQPKGSDTIEVEHTTEQ